ncbi:chloramphenicol acetyltransferase [Agrobacterium rhizogenes]|uniref:rhamnan synthesis F family protein n=1 Tax=Rhizobium rhizogenes TaxID=359 RepID=UPI0022B65EBA|nr:rhamnan synthesis F family protein [Rhizobium rhizogenes]MCZ7447479.1 chloramphenicol acetyltransferase [Rhizobium rhizogenes]
MDGISMTTLEKKVNRLIVYFFWDADGIVDDYVIHALNSLYNYASKVVVVVNGHVNEDGYNKLSSASNTLIIRENYGLDAWAYKAAFEQLGYEYIADFDEVLVTNFTLYGPVLPLSDMFKKMDSTACDFWGLAGYNQKKTDGLEVQHIQSFFVSYRRSLISTKDFEDYWNQLPKIENYADSVNLHELSQTPYFAARGYTFASWASTEKYANVSPANFIITCADRLLVEDSCPFIKRRALFFSNGRFEPGSGIQKIEHITNFIKSRTDYDVSMILENMARTQKPITPPGNNVALAQNRPVSRLQKYKMKIGSRVHPSRKVRRSFRRILAEETNGPVPFEHEDLIWKRYLDCFRYKKPEANLMETWIPNIQHIGRYSYAAPDICIVSVGTVIGSFCSIGQRVVIGHGNHPKAFLSTSPFFYFDELGFKSQKMPTYDGFWYIEPVIIGNDVWIGDGAWIKNGVKIGDGAIIGARAVVTRDVPPYAIVVRSPAQVIDYRFDEDTIQTLLASKWWDLPDDVIRQIPFDDIERATSFLTALKKDDSIEIERL